MTGSGRGGSWESAWASLEAPRHGGGGDLRMPPRCRELALAAKGFLSAAEGMELFRLAAEASRRAPCLEVGCYCGKSTLFLAAGCRAAGCHALFALDHHRGSPEQQPGEAYFDPELYDPARRRVDTLGAFRRNLDLAGLEQWVIPVVTSSARLSRYWPGLALGLVFIDGGHGEDEVAADVHGWAPRVVPQGYLCMHDLYADPRDGGQGPYHVFQQARASADWRLVSLVDTLGVLERR
jgi:hypothetical protein